MTDSDSPAAVCWHQGRPYSPRYDDVYHSEAGACAQARHVFLGGCGLPQAWGGQADWHIVETGFGLGLSFLTTWQAWRDDPRRPGRLHWHAVEAHPVPAAAIERAAAEAGLATLAEPLLQAWHAQSVGALPGWFQARFDDGAVALRIRLEAAPAGLRALQDGSGADSIFLDGFSPQRNPDMWSAETLAAAARLARPGTRLATWCVAGPVRRELARLGFSVARRAGLAPKRHALAAVFQPLAGSGGDLPHVHLRPSV